MPSKRRSSVRRPQELEDSSESMTDAAADSINATTSLIQRAGCMVLTLTCRQPEDTLLKYFIRIIIIVSILLAMIWYTQKDFIEMLETAGYNVQGHASPSVRKLFMKTGTYTSSLPGNTLIQLGLGLEAVPSNKVFMERMVRAIGLDHDKARAEYFQFICQWFGDKEVTWGRLAMVLVFTATLAEKAMEECRFEQIQHILEWCCIYFHHHRFEEWITVSGGWEMLPVIYEQNACQTIRSFVANMPGKITCGFRLLAVSAALSLGMVMVKAAVDHPK